MNILIAGDYYPQDRVANLIEKDDFSSVFGDVKNIISSVNYSIVNFQI